MQKSNDNRPVQVQQIRDAIKVRYGTAIKHPLLIRLNKLIYNKKRNSLF